MPQEKQNRGSERSGSASPAVSASSSRHGPTGHPIAAAAAAIVLIVLAVLLFGGSPAASSRTAQKRLNVVVSVNQWQSVVSRIAGKEARVSAILTNSGVDAHDFEPSSADQAKIATADVVVVNGAGYDAWASKAAAGGRATVISAAQAAGIRRGQNPHIWFSSHARRTLALAVRNRLSALDPANKAGFDGNYRRWLRAEDAVEARIREVRADLMKNRGSHGSASPKSDEAYAATEIVADYLASDLGLRNATPTGYLNASQNESEPSPADLQQFVSMLHKGGVRLLIVNTQEEDKTARMIEQAARVGGVHIVRLTETRPATYPTTLAWIDALVREFSQALA